MLEKEGAYTVELQKNGEVIESYSSTSRKQFEVMVKEFTTRIVPYWTVEDEKSICKNDRYTIHVVTL